MVKHSLHELIEYRKNLVVRISIIEKGKYAKTNWAIHEIIKLKEKIDDVDFSLELLKKYGMEYRIEKDEV